MQLGLILLLSSMVFLVSLIGLIWNIVVTGRQLSATPPVPFGKSVENAWDILTSKFAVHIICAVGCLVSGLVSAITFIAMVVKG